MPARGIPEAAADLGDRLDSLPGATRRCLAAAARAASAAEAVSWWVGGGPRDLLRAAAGAEVSSIDVDVVVEGDFPRFVAALARELEVPVPTPTPFLTAELALSGGGRLDAACARRERYAAPAVLPEVFPATLREDLKRRDFTANSIAIGLREGFSPAPLIDPTGGRADLERGLLRVHHPESFDDDPTRLFRAVDFGARFGWALEPESAALARSAVARRVADRLSGARLNAVCRRAFGRRASAVEAWSRAFDLGLADAIHGSLGDDCGETRATIERALAELPPGRSEPPDGEDRIWRTGLVAALSRRSAHERESVARRLALDANAFDLLVRGPERVAAATALPTGASPSLVHRALADLSPEELALFASGGARERSFAAEELGSYRAFRLRVDGDSLRSAGVPPGPEMGRALAATLDARLDGRIAADEELDFALRAATAGTDPGRDAG